MNILKTKKSIGILILSMIATNSITYYYTNNNNKQVSELSDVSVSVSNKSSSEYKVKRMDGFNFIKPILYVDSRFESEKLIPLKQSVITIIETYKRINVINSASVYIKEFNGNGWTSINNEEKFSPGSLMKVPELITFLKMDEMKPGSLDKVITYDKEAVINLKTNFNSNSIQLGHKYTVRELLKYMIMYSDNKATELLNRNIDLVVFKKVFTDLNLPAPDWNAKTYPITANEFSVFMRTLYNGSYLTDENSEFATQLLSKCDFKKGLFAGLPANTKVAHKFGESGNQTEQQLSESAIVYLNNNSYVVTVMTKGKDYKQLPQVIKEISNTVYQNMLQNEIVLN